MITVYRHADSYKRYEHPLILKAGDAQCGILRFLSLPAVLEQSPLVCQSYEQTNKINVALTTKY